MRFLRLVVIGSLLCCLAVSQASAVSFHFTVTADPREYDAAYDQLLGQMQVKIGGQGVFQVSCGDIDPPWNIRTRIDNRFTTSAIWYPGIGNHEEETAEDMTWLRDEYNVGHAPRVPLKNLTNQDGPTGSIETTYSWDHENVHCIMLNQYWNGGTAAGSDVATDGDVVPQLLTWLQANMAATSKPVIFVFGHEPAYPYNRHLDDSLNKYPANRDAFWNLLESDTRVKAYMCGHTHYYSKHQNPGGRVWQIDVGNAGNDPGGGEGKTFLDITVDDTDVKFDIWRDGGSGNYTLSETWTVPVNEPVPTDVATPAEAKLQDDTTLVRLPAAISAAFPGFFYVEDTDRTSGIRVDEPAHGLFAGISVTVTGEVKTNVDGERYIDADYVQTGGAEEVDPLVMTNVSLGGGDWQYNAGTGAGQRGVQDGKGTNNIGVLVRVCGEVTHADTDFFYLDDGSNLEDGSGNVGVRARTYGLEVPDEGSFVEITGASSCYYTDSQYHRLIHVSGGLPTEPFVAYNDCIWQSSQPIAANVTTYGIGNGYGGPTSGPLIDLTWGTNTGVTVTLTQSGGVTWQPSTSSGGGDTNPGTDAYTTFGGTVSLVGVIYYGSTGWWVDVEFSGLDPSKTYEFATTSNRGEPTYTNRLTKYTISGTDAFTNASTAGTTITDGGASTQFCTGYNTVNGYVARWTNIDPGADGIFKVRAQVGTGGDAQKAYSFDAFKLEEIP